jgi:hypothetical protein
MLLMPPPYRLRKVDWAVSCAATRRGQTTARPPEREEQGAKMRKEAGISIGEQRLSRYLMPVPEDYGATIFSHYSDL